MERESFENEEIARILNEHYVAIKVDREERPDIDHIYMAVCQVMTGQGGWPLTVIMTPDQEPFFAGTYFPRESKWGRPGLVGILEKIQTGWKKDRDLINDTARQVCEGIQPGIRDIKRVGREVSHSDVIEYAYEQFRRQFDSEYGGFGRPPKFPAPHNLGFLLRFWKNSGEKKALEMVEKTLQSMQKGGIYDHIGFGFSRYSTDRKWLVPHFEKMLYDNALLAFAYVEAFQATGKEDYAQVAREIFTYALRDMISPEGGFYSAEDADSEGIEGKFYVWTQEEVTEALGEEDAALFCRLYNITQDGNFKGKSIPNLIHNSLEMEAAKTGTKVEELRTRIEICRQKLFKKREKRVRPYKDDKILTSWNGLMIAALAKGAAAMQQPTYVEAAAGAVEFIWRKLRREDGRLLARYRDGESALPAYLDDYAFLTWGLIELYQATFNTGFLSRAQELTWDMVELFTDRENGGFFFYGKDAEQLLIRPKEVYDGAVPSGNSVAALNLLRMARLTGNTDFEKLADRQLQAFTGAVGSYPAGHTFFLTALQFAVGPSREIVISVKPNGETIPEMARALQKKFLPNAVLLLHPEGDAGIEIEYLAPFIKDRHAIEGMPTAYVCENFACRSPVTDLEQLLRSV